jgi:hypothetical protein
MNDLQTTKHILLTSVGVSGPKETRYEHAGTEERGRFSAFGLWKLLPQGQRPDEFWFLLTPRARRTSWEAIQAEAARIDVPVVPVDLTGDADDTRDFLEETAGKLPTGCRVTLNVTEGLRHHAFLFYALALYLTAFRDVLIEGVWYCRLDTDNAEDPKPVIDLKPVLHLARWFHALAVFQETGSLRDVAHGMPDDDARRLAHDLSFFFQNGMPVEAGDAAARLLALADGTPLVTGVPLAEELQTLILSEIGQLAGAIFEPHPNSDEPSKRQLPLTDAELHRQAKFIERYFESGQLNLAFGLLREWIVNWIAVHQDAAAVWLHRPSRESIEDNLGGLAEVLKAKDPADAKKKRYRHAAVRDRLSPEQRAWAKRWNSVCDIRNALQHHGMKPAVFEPHRADIQNCKEDWETWSHWNNPPEFGGGRGRLLICSIGLTPGVLYSALAHVKPDRALVICSNDSAVAIEEAVNKAETPVEITRLPMNDPYTGIDELAPLVEAASTWLFEADGIHANLTGGTTLMGVVVSRLVQRAEREYRRPVREFVLIDKRLPEQQREDPWRLGDINYLDCQTETGSEERSEL